MTLAVCSRGGTGLEEEGETHVSRFRGTVGGDPAAVLIGRTAQNLKGQLGLKTHMISVETTG